MLLSERSKYQYWLKKCSTLLN